MATISKIVIEDKFSYWKSKQNQVINVINSLGSSAFYNVGELIQNFFPNVQTSGYNINEWDQGRIVHYKGTSANTIFMPSNIVYLPEGWGVIIYNDGGEDITIDGSGLNLGDSGSFVLPVNGAATVFVDKEASPISWAYYTNGGGTGTQNALYENATNSATDSGTDSYTTSTSFTPTDGRVYWVDFQSSNTTNGPTLTADTTAYDIVKEDGSSKSGMIGKRAHGLYFDGSNNNWIIMDPIIDLESYVTEESTTVTTSEPSADAFEVDGSGFTPTSGNIYQIHFPDSSTTTSPTLVTVGSSPAYDIVPPSDTNNLASPYVGMIGNRTHTLYFDGTDFVIMDPVELHYATKAHDARDDVTNDVYYTDVYFVPIHKYLYSFKFDTANTTTTPTLDVDNNNRTIVQPDGSALEAGMLEARVHELQWDVNANEWYLLDPVDVSSGQTDTYKVVPIQATDSGTDAYDGASTSYSLTDQEVYFVEFDSYSTTDSPTLNLNGSDIPIYTNQGNRFLYMIHAKMHSLKYDSANTRFLVMDPANNVVGKSVTDNGTCFLFEDGRQYCYNTLLFYDMDGSGSGTYKNKGFEWPSSFVSEPRVYIGPEGADEQWQIDAWVDRGATGVNWCFVSLNSHNGPSATYWEVHVRGEGFWR